MDVLLCNVTKCLKEAVADPTWSYSKQEQQDDYFVVDNVVYMGTVNNSSRCVDMRNEQEQKLEKVFISRKIPPLLTIIWKHK